MTWGIWSSLPIFEVDSHWYEIRHVKVVTYCYVVEFINTVDVILVAQYWLPEGKRLISLLCHSKSTMKTFWFFALKHSVTPY